MDKCIYEEDMISKGLSQNYGLIENNCGLQSNNLELCKNV